MAWRSSGRSPRGSADRNAHAPGASTVRPVAPRAGARIETCPRCGRSRREWSLPARERGSKLRAVLNDLAPRASLPARERGSKLVYRDPESGEIRVAPRAGARIETRWMSEAVGRDVVAPRAGA